MAPAKKAKGAPPPADKRTPKKLTRKEKHEVNAAEHRVRGAARHRARINLAKELRPDPPGHSMPVAKAVDGAPRPSVYTEDVGARVCFMFATDPKMTLLKMNADPSLPTVWTFYEWLRQQPTLDKLYSRAREIQCDLKAAEIEEWSARPLIGETTVERSGGKDGDTVEVRRADNVDRARLMVETRKWLLSKERPKKYGVQPLEVGDSGNEQLKALFDALKTEAE